MSEFDNRLIELVRANPSLYEREVRSTPYDSSRKKRELWCSIATSLKTDGKFAVSPFALLMYLCHLHISIIIIVIIIIPIVKPTPKRCQSVRV